MLAQHGNKAAVALCHHIDGQMAGYAQLLCHQLISCAWWWCSTLQTRNISEVAAMRTAAGHLLAVTDLLAASPQQAACLAYLRRYVQISILHPALLKLAGAQPSLTASRPGNASPSAQLAWAAAGAAANPCWQCKGTAIMACLVAICASKMLSQRCPIITSLVLGRCHASQGCAHTCCFIAPAWGTGNLVQESSTQLSPASSICKPLHTARACKYRLEPLRIVSLLP